MNQYQIQASLNSAITGLVSALLEDPLPKPIKRDGKYSVEDAVYIRFNGRMCWVLAMESGTYRTALTREALAASVKQREDEVAAEVARADAEIEFRMEVVDAMVRKGIAKHVALNRTSTRPGLMAAAREYRVI